MFVIDLFFGIRFYIFYAVSTFKWRLYVCICAGDRQTDLHDRTVYYITADRRENLFITHGCNFYHNHVVVDCEFVTNPIEFVGYFEGT